MTVLSVIGCPVEERPTLAATFRAAGIRDDHFEFTDAPNGKVIIAVGLDTINRFRPLPVQQMPIEEAIRHDTRWPHPTEGPQWVVGIDTPSVKAGYNHLVLLVDAILRAVAYASK